MIQMLAGPSKQQERTMPQFQPRPMVVIRNQLLAFLVLHLLGSCAPIHQVERPIALVEHGCSQFVACISELTRERKLIESPIHRC